MMKLSRMYSPKISLLSSIRLVTTYAWQVPSAPLRFRLKRAIAKSEAAIAPSGQSFEKLRAASVCISP